MKKLGICIDGTVRDVFSQFDKLYRKKFIKNMGLVHMNDQYQYVDHVDTYSEEKRLEILEKEKIHLPVTTYDLNNHYEFESDAEFQKFMEDYSLELYGTAPTFEKSIDALNRIQYLCEDKKYFSTTLVCPGKEQVVTSTFYFLTKNACRIKNIVFTKYNNDLWNDFDVIISDSPDVLNNKPENKISIKIDKAYNETTSADYSFESLKDVYNKLEFDYIYNRLTK